MAQSKTQNVSNVSDVSDVSKYSTSKTVPSNRFGAHTIPVDGKTRIDPLRSNVTMILFMSWRQKHMKNLSPSNLIEETYADSVSNILGSVFLLIDMGRFPTKAFAPDVARPSLFGRSLMESTSKRLMRFSRVRWIIDLTMSRISRPARSPMRKKGPSSASASTRTHTRVGAHVHQ